jgi:hypothetical protein
VGFASTPKALHTVKGYPDGVGFVDVSLEHVLEEPRLEELDAVFVGVPVCPLILALRHS